MNEIQLELNELSNLYAELDSMHQKTLLELEKFKEASKYGATFKFEDGNEFFIPVFSISSGLKANSLKPVSYSLNFNESTMVQWIYECDMSLEKNNK